VRGQSETPPQAWGRPTSYEEVANLVGNTPTGVGKTGAGIGLHCIARKHPHRRGEDDDADALALTFTETPPQAWGRHSIVTRTLHEPRNTPTGVGKTPHRTRHRPPHRKHPHGRREDSMKRSTNAWCMEPPPQAWGRPHGAGPRRRRVGNTPTGVGKTSPGRALLRKPRKHPHRRGEDTRRAASLRPGQETPPQAWGRLIRSGVVDPYRGNTPTGVGKTTRSHASTGRSEKHPDRRGEDRFAVIGAPQVEETPPQAWGRRRRNGHSRSAGGNTPTGVGKTWLRLCAHDDQ